MTAGGTPRGERSGLAPAREIRLNGAQEDWILTAEPTVGWEPRNAPLGLIKSCLHLDLVEPADDLGVWRLTPAGVGVWMELKRAR